MPPQTGQTVRSQARLIWGGSTVILICAVPDILPIDLRVKLAICLINLKYIKLIKKVLVPLYEEDIEVNGDLYLDVAEAYMDNGYHIDAEPILRLLVNSQNYHLAAVWLRYGECLKILGDIQGAINAYGKVVSLAPSHLGARMSLSALQQQIGKHDEAVELLEHSTEQRKLTKEEGQMLLQKCHLLNAQGKVNEFFEAAKELMFQEWREVECENMSYLQAIATFKHRRDSLKMHLIHKGKDTHILSEMTQKKSSLVISFDDLWDMFVTLCNVLIDRKMYVEFDEITLLGMLCPFFSQDEKLLRKSQSIYAWNMFIQVIMVSKDNRHNRFCLRKMMMEPNNLMLGIMNGHNSMASGSYRHSLGEYANVFRKTPTDPMMSLCIGLDFIHIASQRFAAKRHYLITQGIVFLHNYLELRGRCQESYYNIGRALHQINITYAALHYYKKALNFPPCIKNINNTFDLSKEIAYNMSLIYLQSGAKEYARYLIYKYCVI
ncbi:General transcription factor IIIC [Mactra antiquata]